MSDMAFVLPFEQSSAARDPTLTLQLSNLTIITLHAISINIAIGGGNGRGDVQRSNIWR